MPEEYVETREGGLYVTGSRVSFASIIYEFRDGSAPETIRKDYPSLSLAQVYGAIAFYLSHPEESESYLRDLRKKWTDLEQQGQPLSDDLRKRLEEARHRLLVDQP
jgi:uncharacterized protein (DUF433 family)